MAEKSDLDKDSLKIGDYIILRDLGAGVFLAVEGILNDDIGGMPDIDAIHDAIFCVHLQRQYSASRELNTFLQKHDMDSGNVTEVNELNYLKALERGRDNENSLNDTYMKKKMGQVVLFGDVIQLFHVKSGKYLQIYPNKLAKDERDNYRIGLDSNGDALSWIQICPRFKIDKEGDRIMSNAEVYMKVAAGNNEYIHTALREPAPGSFREINCSLELTSWRLSIYQSSTDNMQKSLLLASQLIYIHDPETKSYLSVLPAEKEETDLLGITTDSNSVDPLSNRPHSLGIPHSLQEDEEVLDLPAVLVPAPSDALDSNFLWMLEGSHFLTGGAIKWKTEQVRFKHFNSGKYLYLETLLDVAEDGTTTRTMTMRCTHDRHVPETLFSINEVNSTAKYLRNSKPVQMSFTGQWVARGEIVSDASLSFSLNAVKEKEQAVSLMLNRFSANQMRDKILAENDVHEVEEEDLEQSKDPIDAFVGLSARNYMRKYYDMTDVSTLDTANTLWPDATRSDIEAFKAIVEKIVIFVRGFPVTTVHVHEGVDKADARIEMARQNLFRQQGTLELIILFIMKVLPLFEMVESGKAKKTLDNSLLMRMAQMIQAKCFVILYYLIRENPVNQIYVADYMPILLRSLNSQELAVKCVTEMLSKNDELQETKIGKREIQIFVDKLKFSKGNTMYLKLLQAVCSCQGNGVDGNQCKVAELLFEDTSDILIRVHADYAFCHKIDWGSEASFYINAPVQEESEIKGQSLITKGIPRLSLSWVSNKDNRHEGHIGTVEELFDPVLFMRFREETNLLASSKSNTVTSPSSKSNQGDGRQNIRDYFLAEMFLGAEMCLDRNYLSMHQLDNYFSYDVLVAMLKLSVSSSLKAAAIRLLMCLYVDRDPQASSKIPMLTRTWSDIKKNTEPQLPFVEPRRRYHFALIQQMISEHLRDMSGNHWDDLSRHVLKMLLTLVRFNFYGTTERMNDVIIPLINALDRRQVVFADAVSVRNAMSERNLAIIGGAAAAGAQTNTNSKSRQISTRSEAINSIPEGDEGESDKERNEAAEQQDDDDVDDASSLSTFAVRKNRNSSRTIALQHLRQRLESSLMSSFIVTLTCLALLLDIYQIVFSATFRGYGIISLIEIGILGIFAIEISLRIFCALLLDRAWYRMFLDPINLVDFGFTGADIVIYFTSVIIDQGASFLKIGRLIRILRLIRAFQNAKIEVADDVNMREGNTQAILRYTRAPIMELNTMVEAVQVLAFMQKLIEDRNLTIFLRCFYLWETNADRRTPGQIFRQVLEDSTALTLSVEDFEHVMLDCLMFSHSPLVQSVLEVLMAHYSQNATILRNAKDVQLLGSSKREKQFKQVESMLKTLEQNAETHELWGELHSEEDQATNKETNRILTELINLCRVRRFVLEFDQDYSPDVEIQNLYRNLDCFEICLKVLNLLDSVKPDEDGVFSDIALNTREICKQCNNVLYWFLLDNPKNQAIAFEELGLFLKHLDSEINSHLVIQALFKNNEALMRLVPHTHLAEMIEKIVQDSKNGKSHHYLALFGAIAYVEERSVVEGKVMIEQKNIVENQLEIVKSLTAPGRLQKVSCFFVPIDHPEYQLKRELMEPFLDVAADLSLEDLPPLLAYHLMFLEVLSGCTVGRANITTVEAKVQSVFNYVDIVQSILDPGTITACKIRLSRFFYNSIIETDLRINGLEQASCVWKLIQSFTQVLGYAKDEIRKVEKLGWESHEVSRQRIEYIMVCIMIAGGFFDRYYDPLTFRFIDGPFNTFADRVQISQTQVNELITSLFNKIKDVYDLDSPRLSPETKSSIFTALETLNSKASKVIVNNLQPNTASLHATREQVTAEGKLLEKYTAFVNELNQDELVTEPLAREKVDFINLIESLPRNADRVHADIRYEALIKRLVNHISDSIVVSETRKFLDTATTKTSTWIMRSFRTMIENKMGMTIYDRDEDGGLEQDELCKPVIDALSACGVVALCLDLIADGIDNELQLEAIKLGIAMLFKEGGALQIQTMMNEHLSKTNSECFFLQVRLILQKLKAWHEWRKIIILGEGEEPKPPEEIWIIRFLQLMCEGHFMPNQDIVREQKNNAYSFNLLDDFVMYLNSLSRIPCRTSTAAAIRVAATILEVIQGPCENNQVHFALSTELIETLNRINRTKVVHDCLESEEVLLKRVSIDIVQGLLEGQGEKSVVYERVLSVIHLDVIQMMSKGLHVWSDDILPSNTPTDDTEGHSSNSDEEDTLALKTESMILLQMLCNFKPSLYEELSISREIEDIVGSGTAMIEIVWRGDIHQRFFQIPKLCEFLAKSSKDNLVEFVDRSNAENKLIDFLKRSHDLYLEVKHQEYLTKKNLSRVFSRENQNRATWITFTLAMTINALFIAFYMYDDNGNKFLKGKQIIQALNIIQLCVAAFVSIQNSVVRSPVIYQSFEASGHSRFYVCLYTALDPMTMYFALYLVFSFLGLFVANYFLPFLLLDIVAKNATTRDILNAVVLPRMQLIMTIVLAVFVNYIYAYFYFLFFGLNQGGIWEIGVFEGNNDCETLWGCFKFVLCYGIRQGGGVGDVMNLSIGNQWIADFTYFLIVIVMLLNIIFGIIIDTFSSLRAMKLELISDTTEVCFICGIGKQTFDRASLEPDGFETHIKLDHNMWNYLYYIFMLWEQDRDDDDGLEQYVRRAIDRDEISWFPLHKAKRLEQAATEEEQTVLAISKQIEEYERNILKKVLHFQTEVTATLEQISNATKQSYNIGDAKMGIARYLQDHAMLEASAEDNADLLDIPTATSADLDNDSMTEAGDTENQDNNANNYNNNGEVEKSEPWTTMQTETLDSADENQQHIQLSLPPQVVEAQMRRKSQESIRLATIKEPKGFRSIMGSFSNDEETSDGYRMKAPAAAAAAAAAVASLVVEEERKGDHQETELAPAPASDDTLADSQVEPFRIDTSLAGEDSLVISAVSTLSLPTIVAAEETMAVTEVVDEPDDTAEPVVSTLTAITREEAENTNSSTINTTEKPVPEAAVTSSWVTEEPSPFVVVAPAIVEEKLAVPLAEIAEAPLFAEVEHPVVAHTVEDEVEPSAAPESQSEELAAHYDEEEEKIVQHHEAEEYIHDVMDHAMQDALQSAGGDPPQDVQHALNRFDELTAVDPFAQGTPTYEVVVEEQKEQQHGNEEHEETLDELLRHALYGDGRHHEVEHHETEELVHNLFDHAMHPQQEQARTQLQDHGVVGGDDSSVASYEFAFEDYHHENDNHHHDAGELVPRMGIAEGHHRHHLDKEQHEDYSAAFADHLEEDQAQHDAMDNEPAVSKGLAPAPPVHRDDADDFSVGDDDHADAPDDHHF